MNSAAPGACTVYLVDDDPASLKLLARLVASLDAEARQFSSAKEFLAAFLPGPCQCLVCDLRMPGMDGLALQRSLNATDIAPPIIFLTGFAEVAVAVEAMRQGAFDFLEKPFSAHALLNKVEAALATSRDRYAAHVARRTAAARLAVLTPKERAVLRYVVDGLSSRRISALLGLSVRTVEHHRDHIMQKLHVGSTVELVKLCLGERWNNRTGS